MRCRFATDKTNGSVGKLATLVDGAGGGAIGVDSRLAFWSLDERPCSHSVMGTASTNGTDLVWPTERAPRKSIQSGSILTHQTSRGSDQRAYRDNCGLVVVSLGIEDGVGVAVVVGVEESSTVRSVAVTFF